MDKSEVKDLGSKICLFHIMGNGHFMEYLLAGGFSCFSIFTPTWGNDPI